jgi:hypothetical protein
MKPLQFSQNKQQSEWQWMFANNNTTKLNQQLEDIRKSSPYTHRTMNSPVIKKKVATLLYEYYSIIFRNDIFRPLTNLERLFPTAEPIYISDDTNFILFPLPLPTYAERTCRWLKANTYPILSPTLLTNEFIHEADFLTDNVSITKARTPQANNIKNYPHLNPLVKYDLTHSDLDSSAHLWTYKYKDISPKDKDRFIKSKILPTANQIAKYWYSLRDIQSDKLEYPTIERKYTFLEITPPKKVKPYPSDKSDNPDFKKASMIRLKNYSKNLYLNYFNNWFRYFFYRFPDRQEAIINYLIQNSYCCQYSIPEIKAAIRQAKEFMKYSS